MSAISGYIPISQVLQNKKRKELKVSDQKAASVWRELSLSSNKKQKSDKENALGTSPGKNSKNSPSKALSVIQIDPTDEAILLTPSVVASTVSSDKPLFKTPTKKEKPPIKAFESPPMKSPCQYHYGSYFDTQAAGKINKVVKKFRGKELHTLAPDDARDDAHLIMNHYPALRDSKKLTLDSVTIKMPERDRFVVEREGIEREFGVHRQTQGEGHKRLYPKSGSGFISLKGSDFYDYLNEYKANLDGESFFEQLAERVKNSSPSPDALPPIPEDPSL